MHVAADATTIWRRSSHCADAACLEIADAGDAILMRDSKDNSQPTLRFQKLAWEQFIDSVKVGDFDRP